MIPIFETSKEKKVYSRLYEYCIDPETDSYDHNLFANIFTLSPLEQVQLENVYNDFTTMFEVEAINRKEFGLFCKIVTLKICKLNICKTNIHKDLIIPQFLIKKYNEQFLLFERSFEIEVSTNKFKWNLKYGLTLKRAEKYFSLISKKFSKNALKNLDSVALTSTEAIQFFSIFNVRKKLKKKLWFFLDQRNENEIKISKILLAIHFLTIKMKYDIWFVSLLSSTSSDPEFREFVQGFLFICKNCKTKKEFINKFFDLNQSFETYSDTINKDCEQKIENSKGFHYFEPSKDKLDESSNSIISIKKDLSLKEQKEGKHFVFDVVSDQKIRNSRKNKHDFDLNQIYNFIRNEVSIETNYIEEREKKLQELSLQKTSLVQNENKKLLQFKEKLLKNFTENKHSFDSIKSNLKELKRSKEKTMQKIKKEINDLNSIFQ